MSNSVLLKLGALLAILALATVGGLYLSGMLVPMLLKVQASTPWYETWWSYFRVLDLPQVKPHAGKIKLATAIGFGLPVLALLPLATLALKPRHKALHGDARFASSGDLARKDMFKLSPDGVVVGKMGGKLIRLPGQQFVILAAPTRSGKGVGIVIPNLLDYAESMVVLDIKQENFELTSGWRASQGQEIYLFNPFAEDRRTHRWNPLSYVSPDPAFRISDLQSIAAMLYPDGASDQKFWVSQARNAFMAFGLYLFEQFDDQYRQNTPKPLLKFPTLGAIYRLSSGDGTDLKQFLRERSEKPFLSGEAKRAFAGMLSQADETFASIMGTFKEPLNAWINPVLDAATSADDFLLTDVRRKRMTVYIGIQPNKLAESRLIVNLFFSQLINQNTRELPQNNPELKHQCLLLMDEFTSIGKVEIISTAIAYMAGYNIRLLPIIQSMAQLDAVYGKDVSRTMITNHALQIVYAPREQQDANDYSEMLGYTTHRIRNRSRSYGRQGNTTLSENEQRRALMLPQELKAMGFDQEVFFYEGIPHPVLCEKIKYFKDGHFTKRLLPKVKIPTLQIGGNEMKLKPAAAAIAAAAIATAACASPAAGPSTPETPAMSAAKQSDRQDDRVPVAWPLRFKTHQFGVRCYDTLGCKVRYDEVEHGDDDPAPPSSTYGPDYLDNWNGSHGMIRNFPPPAEVSWRSKDGESHEAKVDIGALFADQLVRHKAPRNEIKDQPEGVPGRMPSILLEVNDRTIRVYMREMIFTKHLQIPGNQYSDFINDLILVKIYTF